MKRVKLIRGLPEWGISAGTEFTVETEDDGFYTDNPFYSGWVKNQKGRKFYLSFDQADCKVIEW